MINRLLITLVVIVSHFQMAAQWTFDVTSVEAYINDHKHQRALLLARATLEQSNDILHGLSADAAEEYKAINIDLDKYTRAFDVIDIIYQSVRTGMNVYDTYDTISRRVNDYKAMLTQYNERILQRNKIELSDVRIVTISLRCIENIYGESQALYNSLTDLVLYATGLAACSTADLMLVFESINISLDNIKAHINRAYLDTWRYIQVRIGYWKAEVYRKKGIPVIVNEAFGRWRDSSLNPLRK